MEKLCTSCDETKDSSEFAKHNKRADGLQSYCIQCKKVIDARYYKKNSSTVIKRNVRNKRAKLDWLHEYKKSLKCIKCGEDHPATLDFHHRDKDTKLGQLADLIQRWSIARAKTEIDKCDVLCANCHRKLHYEERHGP